MKKLILILPLLALVLTGCKGDYENQKAWEEKSLEITERCEELSGVVIEKRYTGYNSEYPECLLEDLQK